MVSLGTGRYHAATNNEEGLLPRSALYKRRASHEESKKKTIEVVIPLSLEETSF